MINRQSIDDRNMLMEKREGRGIYVDLGKGRVA
jgi:hypothetical protein